ncbi:MAG TPA: family 43 glycosylhydrolase [Phycisphaerae bacterium]
MKYAKTLFGCACLATLSFTAVGSAPAGAPPQPSNGIAGTPVPGGDWQKHWTADNGNGTYSNPLFYEEFEDPDVIRVGNDYYLASTTMHMMPAVFLMHSKDLVNWELAGYCADKLDLGPQYHLENGNIYGKGIWAPCIRYHNGRFYVFANVNNAQLQVYSATDIKGPWEHWTLPGHHDLSVLFDDELNKIFIISGGGNKRQGQPTTYTIDEISPDVHSMVANAHHTLSVPVDGVQMGEGHHLYKIKGKYYDISAIPGGAVNQVVAKADRIDGPWTVTVMVNQESLGVPGTTPSRAQPNDRGLWLHQGGMVDTPSGEWWCTIMSDHGNGGRMTSLVPITWDDGFPLIGLPGNLRKAPNTWIKPNTGVQQQPIVAFPHDDNFDGPKLVNTWQWNHVEDDTKWSLSENPGKLRLHSLPAQNLFNAKNTQCMKPPGPESILTVELDGAGMKEGDSAGLGVIQSPCASIGFVKTADGLLLQESSINVGGGGRRGGGGGATPAIAKGPDNPPSHIWLRLHINMDTDQCQYSYSTDGRQFTNLGASFLESFSTNTTFQGIRPGLYHFNTSDQSGGYADFDNFSVVEPRAHGIEREIPAGKVIVLTSGADDTFLAADAANSKLVNVAGGADAPANARFQVIDLGQGRVALKASNGRFVSAAGADGAVLKDLGAGKPSDAESFQWVNLMRGDTMLMSLVNHQYLNTKTGVPGAVTIDALGASPARKSGAEFKWKEVK